MARVETQVSFRGAPPAALGTVTVTGSVSGAHAGQLLAHSDGQGASFVPAKRFSPGETVTVASDAVDFAFTVAGARRPVR